MGAAGFPLARRLSNRYHRNFNGRPNILFITTDYQAGEDLPATGSPFLQMPNVDRLCGEGVIFENFYCTAPICTPARYTLITGQYPHTHGQWDNYSRWVPEDSPILMEELGRGGYQTVGIGKMHFHAWDRMAGFDRRIIADNKGNDKSANLLRDDYARFLEKHGLTRWSYLQKQWQTDLFGVYDWPYHERFHIDHFVGEQTVNFIRNGNLKAPWFNWVSFNGPHNPWDPPSQYSDPYKRMELPAARLHPEELNNKPADHTRLRYNYTRQVSDRLDQVSPDKQTELIHRIRAGHYGGLSFIDHQIGRIIEALEVSGQLENTIIIYSADHGCQLGDHHLIHKGVFYERSAAVPFVVWGPDRFSPKRELSYGGFVDLFPTLLSLADIPITDRLEKKLEGRDLSPVLEGQPESAKQEEFLEIRHGTAIVTDQWKYSIYPRDGYGELYDRKEDPDELYDLFNDPGYRKVRCQLQNRIIAFHPPLADQIAEMTPLAAGFTPRKEWKLEQGLQVPSEEAPYQQGKRIQIEVTLKPLAPKWSDGPLLVATVANEHGYALYLREDRLELAVRRWGEDTVIVSPEPLPSSMVTVGAGITPDGLLTLSVDDNQVSAGRIASGIPVQPGSQRVLAPSLYVGFSPDWHEPMGAYGQEDSFEDEIHNLILQVE